MSKKQSNLKSTHVFLDLKFFLGLIFAIYGFLLFITGNYYMLNPILNINSNIDIFWGLLMFVIGIIVYYKSDKPSSWNKAFAVSGIERIENRLKSTIEEVTEELE